MIKFLNKLFGGKEEATRQSEERLKANEPISPATELDPLEEPEQFEEEIHSERQEQQSIIPIIDDPSERKYNEPFRKSDDEENVVRIIQKPPKGTPKKVAELVPIAGIKRRENEALKVITSTNFAMRLEQEPDNPYDKNAIKVFGDCEIDGEETSYFLGYIPREDAKKLAKYNVLKATVRMIFLPTSTKTIGFRLDIWSERANKKNKKTEEKPYDENIEIPIRYVDKNLKGEELEREGYIDNAIEIYEASLKEHPQNRFPYRRLVVIYRRRKQYDKEIKVIEQAISNFQDNSAILEDYKKRLERAKELYNKAKKKE